MNGGDEKRYGVFEHRWNRNTTGGGYVPRLLTLQADGSYAPYDHRHYGGAEPVGRLYVRQADAQRAADKLNA